MFNLYAIQEFSISDTSMWSPVSPILFEKLVLHKNFVPTLSKIVYAVAENPPFQFEFPNEMMGFQFKAQENIPNTNIISKVYKGPTPLVHDFVNLIKKNLRDLRRKKAIASVFDVIVLSREMCEPILDSWYQHNSQ